MNGSARELRFVLSTRTAGNYGGRFRARATAKHAQSLHCRCKGFCSHGKREEKIIEKMSTNQPFGASNLM